MVIKLINNPMKNFSLYCLNLVIMLLFLMMTSCGFSSTYIPVKGNGEPVDKNYKVSDFHGIDVSSGFDVILIQGNSEEVTLTMQENLFEHITVKVDQGILMIYAEKGLISTRPMKARISYKSIDNLKVSGGGDTEAETPINVPKLDVNISGGGDLTLKCKEKADEANIVISGGGNLNASNLQTETVSFTVSGGSDINVNASKELKGTISGGGDVYYSGNPGLVDIDARGGSEVHKQ